MFDMGSRVPVSVVGVDSGSAETPRNVEKGDGQLAPLEAISLLVAQLLHTAQEGQWMDGKAHLEGKSSPLSAVSPGPGTERGHSVKEWARVCFLCGRQGHGVNRCSQVDTSVPFLPLGWSVDVRNGQYQATQTDGTRLGSTPGNEGWSGREGQPSGPSEFEVQLTLAGELLVRGDASRLGSCRWSVGSDLTGLRVNRLFHHWGATLQRIVDGMSEICGTALKGCCEVGTQWCRSLRLRWVEVLCRWFPGYPELGDMGGGCGLLEGVGRFRKVKERI